MGVLSSLGIGSATVDLVVPGDRLTAGETVDARVDVAGGSDEQQVDEIYFALRTRYRTDEGNRTATVSEFAVEDGFAVGPDEELSFDVPIAVPPETPTTVYGDIDVWIDTGLDIDWAADPDDEDPVAVEPQPSLAALLDAVVENGFDLESSACRSATGTPFAADRQFVQTFEYRPLTERYRAELDEVEVVASPADGGVEVLLEVDRTDTAFGEREHRATFTVASEDAEAVAGTVEDRIEQFL